MIDGGTGIANIGNQIRQPRPLLHDLDYDNGCTQQFITDVCTYWLDRYQLDGIRFDYVGGIYDPTDPPQGIPKLIPRPASSPGPLRAVIRSL